MGPPEGGPFPFCSGSMWLNFSLVPLNFGVFYPGPMDNAKLYPAILFF